MTEGNGHDDDDDDSTPAPIDWESDRTPPDGLRAKGASRAANFHLALQAACQHLRRAVRDGVELAQMLAGIRGGVRSDVLRDISDKCREIAGRFLQAARDFDEARRRRSGGG